MYKLEIGDSDPDYCKAYVYETKEEVFLAVGEIIAERLDGASINLDIVQKIINIFKDKKSPKSVSLTKLVSLYNKYFFEKFNGDFMTITEIKTNNQPYGSMTEDKILEILQKTKEINERNKERPTNTKR